VLYSDAECTNKWAETYYMLSNCHEGAISGNKYTLSSNTLTQTTWLDKTCTGSVASTSTHDMGTCADYFIWTSLDTQVTRYWKAWTYRTRDCTGFYNEVYQPAQAMASAEFNPATDPQMLSLKTVSDTSMTLLVGLCEDLGESSILLKSVFWDGESYGESAMANYSPRSSAAPALVLAAAAMLAAYTVVSPTP